LKKKLVTGSDIFTLFSPPEGRIIIDKMGVKECGDLGEPMGSARRQPELRQGTRVKLRVSNPRYDGCEGVVLPQGCGEERGRIGVQLIYYDDKDSRLMYGPKKQVSVGRDKLLVLSPRHEASDERKEVRTLPSPANFNHGQCDDGVGLPVPLSSSSREDHTQRAQLRLVTDEEMD
jgi:hypothetical protein